MDKYVQENLKPWYVWHNLFKSRKFTPNKGLTSRLVIQEYAPLIRSQANPAAISSAATVDVTLTRERYTDFTPCHHKFETPAFSWLPEFVDFFGHVKMNMTNITQQIAYFTDLVQRTKVWHSSRYVMVPGHNSNLNVTIAPTGPGSDDGSTGKTNAWLAATIAAVGNVGTLSFDACQKAVMYMAQQQMLPFKGNSMPNGDSSPLNGKWLLICGAEAQANLRYDPWFLANRTLDTNVTTAGFSGDVNGTLATRIEQFPFRILFDTSKQPGNPDAYSYPAPQTVDVTPGSPSNGELIPNPDYLNAQFEVAWCVSGNSPYEALEVGPPPGDFSKMPWNGKPFLNDQLNIPCTVNGQTVWKPNVYKEFLDIKAYGQFGSIVIRDRGILPIVFRRFAGAASAPVLV